MKKENNFDKFDEMFLEYFNKNKDIPESTQNIIDELFKKNPHLDKQ